MKMWKGMMIVGAAAGLVLAAGCEEKNNPVTKATDAAKDAGSKMAEGAKDVTAAAKDAGTKAVEGAKTAATDAADAAAAKLAEAKAAGASWVSGTVEKDWPAMKTQLEGYAAKVTDIKDPGVKVKAEAMVKDLQAQVPAIEKLVGEIKNFKSGDMTALMDNAKKAWDGFSSKLGELKSLIPG